MSLKHPIISSSSSRQGRPEIDAFPSSPHSPPVLCVDLLPLITVPHPPPHPAPSHLISSNELEDFPGELTECYNFVFPWGTRKEEEEERWGNRMANTSSGWRRKDETSSIHNTHSSLNNKSSTMLCSSSSGWWIARKRIYLQSAKLRNGNKWNKSHCC